MAQELCPRCGMQGSKVGVCSSCEGTGLDPISQERCSVCKGNGKCPSCGGTGRVDSG